MTISSNTRCLFDTNILIYSTIKSSPKYEKSKQLFIDLTDKKLQAAISTQNLLEFGTVMINAYNLPKKSVADDINSFFSDEVLEIIYPQAETIRLFTQFLSHGYKIHPSDLFLAATALSHNIHTIITNDRDFLKIKEITFYNPFQ